MHRRLLPVIATMLLIGPMESVSMARGVPVPVFWGWGETVSTMGELPPGVIERVAEEWGADVSVGFLYEHCHVYHADLWTWNGRHVLFDGTKYLDPSDNDWRQLLGHSVTSEFGKPVLYRLPLVPTGVLSLVALWYLRCWLFPDAEARFRRLCANAKYQRALKVVLPDDEHPLRTTYDRHEFEAGIASLTADGVAEQTARRNLETVLTAVVAAREVSLAGAFQEAVYLAENGHPTQGVETLEQLAEALPPTDPRRLEVVRMLASIRDRAAGATSSADS